MNKTLNVFSVLASLAALTLLPSCSSDEIIDDHAASNVISFSVTTDKDSRSADFYCNNFKPNDIYVTALYDQKGDDNYGPYMTNVLYSKAADASLWKATSAEVHFWPVKGQLVFFATNMPKAATYADGSIAIDWNTRKMTYTVPKQAGSQKDIIYAVNKQARPTSGTASLNFRHALSMIVFKAQNSLKYSQITIESVSINAIAQKGVFTFPTASTNDNVNDHNGTGTYPGSTSIGTWSNLEYPGNRSAGGKFFTANANTNPTVITVDDYNNNRVINLTDLTLSGGKESNFGGALMLIPQTRAAWNPKTAAKPFEQNAGAYLTVKCKIQNIAVEGQTAPSASDIYLWSDGNGGCKEFAIPLDINWEPGKKYVYTINFNGNGTGYDPDNGNEVLVPVTLRATVENFTQVNVSQDMFK